MKLKYCLPARWVLVLVLIFCAIAPMKSFAQIDFEDDVEDVPLDGGVTVMIAAGVAYGIKKARVGRYLHKKNDETTSINENEINA